MLKKAQKNRYHTTNMGFATNLLFQVLGPKKGMNPNTLTVKINFHDQHTTGFKKTLVHRVVLRFAWYTPLQHKGQCLFPVPKLPELPEMRLRAPIVDPTK